jgi:hypothetical protein
MAHPAAHAYSGQWLESSKAMAAAAQETDGLMYGAASADSEPEREGITSVICAF